MTKWEVIHAHYPIICEGEPGRRKGRYNGCAAWNSWNEKCGMIYRASDDESKGMCSYSSEQAIQKEKRILKGQE